MRDVFLNVSLGNILLSAVFAFFLAALWYSPVLFRRQWLSIIDKQADELQFSIYIYVASLVWWLFASYMFAVLVNMTQSEGQLSRLLVLVVIAWFCFGKTPLVLDHLYLKKNAAMLTINGAYHFLAFLLMALVHAFL